MIRRQGKDRHGDRWVVVGLDVSRPRPASLVSLEVWNENPDTGDEANATSLELTPAQARALGQALLYGADDADPGVLT